MFSWSYTVDTKTLIIDLDETILSTVTYELYRVCCVSPLMREAITYYGSCMSRSPECFEEINIGLYDNGLHDYQLNININTLKLLGVLVQEDNIVCAESIGFDNILYILKHYCRIVPDEDEEMIYVRVRDALYLLAFLVIDNENVISYLNEEIDMIQCIGNLLNRLKPTGNEFHRLAFTIVTPFMYVTISHLSPNVVNIE